MPKLLAALPQASAIKLTWRMFGNGGIVALPSFLYATDRIVSGYVGGLPGVHAMWSGADWNWHKPVRRNDEISTEVRLKDLTVHETRFAGRAVQTNYTNVANPVAAVLTHTIIDIDDEACERVMRMYHLETKRDAVNLALRKLAIELTGTSS